MKINILIWLPASGKSTYIKENKQEDDLVLSSDEIRKEIFWDESSQEDNWLVFDTLHKRLVAGMFKATKVIWIDATNITKKNRRKIINVIKWTSIWEVEIIWIIFELPISELIKRDSEIDRVVWEDVIMRMIWQYQPPKLEEWFKELILIDRDSWNCPKTFKTTLDLYWYLEIIKNDSFIARMRDLEQNSYYHQETLSKHLELIEKQIEWWEYNPNYKLLILLILFHDIWKFFTRKTKRENLLARWYTEEDWIFKNKSWEIKEVSRPDDYQFLWHEIMSANIYRFNFKDDLIWYWLITYEEAEIIEVIVKWHLLFHKLEEQEIKIDWIIYKKWEFIFDLWKEFSDYDTKWRITLEIN